MSAQPAEDPDHYPLHRSEAEWVARWNECPELYEDLCNVLSGHRSLSQIGSERAWARQRRERDNEVEET